MRYALTTLLSTVAACAIFGAIPASAGTGSNGGTSATAPSAAAAPAASAAPAPSTAASGTGGNGADARGQQEQAELHPRQANQTPRYVPGGVPVGEVYPQAGPQAFYGPNGVRSAYGDEVYPAYGGRPGTVYVTRGADQGPFGVVGAIIAAPFDATAGIVGGMTGAPAYASGYGVYAPASNCETYRDFNGRWTSLCGAL